MAVIDLKREKRVNVNGEWDKVTTHPNNEPIFRQNGYQLDFDGGNNDKLKTEFSFVTGDLIKSKFILTKDWIGQGNQYCYNVDDNTVRLLFNGTAGTIISSPNAQYNSIKVGGEIKDLTHNFATTLGQVVEIEIELTGDLTPNQNFNFNGTAAGSNVMGVQLLELMFNDVNIPIVDIDENAQILRSDGELANIITSSASGTDYILGTVFQKSSFALGLDKSNNEYLKLSNESVSTFSDLKIAFILDYSRVTSFDRLFYWGDASGSNGAAVLSYITFGGDILVQSYDNSNTLIVSANLGAPTGVNKVEIKDSKIYLDGVEKFDGTSIANNSMSDLTTTSFEPKIGSNHTGTEYADITLIDLLFQNTNYPLTEGLGNTTNGAEIITSAADSNERINFGMWQKNGNVLKFDGVNSDYLEFPFTPLSQFSDLSFEVKGTFTPNTGGGQIFSYGNPSTITGSYGVLMTGVGQVYFQCFNTNRDYFLNQFIETISGTVQKTYSFDGTYFYIDGVNSFDFSASANEPMNPSSANLPRVGEYYNNTRPLTGIIYEVKLQNKNFLFREGQGETTTSEDGTTTAEIKTSAADSENYINEFVWNEDSGKWIDYKKV